MLTVDRRTLTLTLTLALTLTSCPDPNPNPIPNANPNQAERAALHGPLGTPRMRLEQTLPPGKVARPPARPNARAPLTRFLGLTRAPS